MSTAIPAISRHPETLQKIRPLISVINWELRRVRASKITWIMAGVTFCLFFFLAQTVHTSSGNGYIDSDGKWHIFYVAGTSARGMLTVLPTFMYIIAIAVPFVCTDTMARDLKRGTYELLMATKIPSWAYAWGRYLVSLFLCFILALEMLVAILCMGWFFYFQGPDYPAPQISAVIILWAAVILPSTLLLSSLGFALGTWLPRHTGLLKVGIFICWFYTPAIVQNLPDFLPQWDPTYIFTLMWASNQYIFRSTPETFLPNFLQLEQRLPDIWPWLPPHLILAGLGILLVSLAISSFKRFKNLMPQQTSA
jgi:ABC-type transport system involved in multi-copper enzyme maturation permease subunit